MSVIEQFGFIFCLIVLIFGFFGNVLVIVTFSGKDTKLNTCEVFMISLAVSDLFGTFCIPLLTMLHYKSVEISFLGNFGCQFLYWLSTTSLTVSAFSLVTISIDRFMIVIWPYREQPKTWKVVLTTFLVWMAASFLGLIYFFRVRYSSESNMCRVIYKDNMEDTIHTLSMFIIQVVLPIIIMSVMYGIMLRRLWSQRIRKLSADRTFLAIREKRNKKSTKLLLTVVIVFFVLTLPFHIFYMWYTFYYQTIRPENENAIKNIYHILVLILLSNSCVNPLIYARLHKSFRRNTLRFLCPCLVKRFPSLCDASFSITSSGSSRWLSVHHRRFSTSSAASSCPRNRSNTLPSLYQTTENLRSSCRRNTVASVYQDRFSCQLQPPENMSDDATSLCPLGNNSTGQAMLHQSNEHYSGTKSVNVFYFKNEKTADCRVRKNDCVLNWTEEHCELRANGSISQSSPSKEQRNVKFSILHTPSHTLIDNTETSSNGSIKYSNV